MATGIIKSIRADRGFGFIERDSGRDIFFHIRESHLGGRDFDDSLLRLDVTFDEETDERNGKLRAVNVKPVR